MITNVFSSVFGGHESKLITNVTDVLVYLGVHDTELFDSKVKRFRVAAMAIGDFDAKNDGTLGTKLQQVKAYIYEDVVYQSTFHKSRMICTDSSKRKAGAREVSSKTCPHHSLMD
ncbi:hypothetical protein D918_00328 [Trichuris suis]|nr:hypothetical protein D918_00328 [Trichuris suis]